MLKIFSITIAMLCALQSIAQSKNDYNWVLTGQYDADTPQAEGYHWKFTDDGLVREYLETPDGIFRSIVTMSDDDGNLLFYSNGCAVYNAAHELMDNGGDVNNVTSLYSEFCPGGYPGGNNMVVIDDPGNEKGYYIIHKPLEYNDILLAKTNSILYSYVDMSFNDGLGRLTVKNEEIYSDTITTWGYLNACKHENGKDWWLLQIIEGNNTFLSFKVDEFGISLESEKSTGPSQDGSDGALVQAVYNRDGTKYATHSIENHLVVYDFIRASGELEFEVQIFLGEEIPFDWSRGAMFSPNNRFLYANTENELYQIDMWEEDLNDGVELIAAWDGFVEETVGVPVKFGNLTHGPDCKIYMSSPAGIQYMHMIEYPDEKGVACGFKQHSIKLDIPMPPLFSNIIPFYRMDESAPCDPTLVGLADVYGIGEVPYRIYPNPVSDVAILDVEPDAEIVSYELMTIDGQVLRSADVSDLQSTIDMSGFASGMYFLRVYDVDGAWEVAKVVKE